VVNCLREFKRSAEWKGDVAGTLERSSSVSEDKDCWRDRRRPVFRMSWSRCQQMLCGYPRRKKRTFRSKSLHHAASSVVRTVIPVSSTRHIILHQLKLPKVRLISFSADANALLTSSPSQPKRSCFKRSFFRSAVWRSSQTRSNTCVSLFSCASLFRHANNAPRIRERAVCVRIVEAGFSSVSCRASTRVGNWDSVKSSRWLWMVESDRAFVDSISRVAATLRGFINRTRGLGRWSRWDRNESSPVR
jgi:hypothetical protein